MQEEIIRSFGKRLKARIEEIMAEFSQRMDFSGLEKAINEEIVEFSAQLQQALLCFVLSDKMFLSALKTYAGKLGMHLKEFRAVTVTLSNGQRVQVMSPYFVKAKAHSKRKRRKRGPNGTGAHLGLQVLGFIGHASPGLLSYAVQMALLCPSYEVACTVLAERGVTLNIKSLRRLCWLAGHLDNDLRGRIALTGHENLRGYTLVISIDGGRIRERKRKRGRRAKHLKRQGYHADWREPKLFTIYLTNVKGEIVKEFTPLHDATMGDHEAAFALLETYLRNLELEQLDRVVFCGDGGSWIWNDVKKLCNHIGFPENTVYQVLDYTHAKQNLNQIVDMLAPTKQAAVAKKWKNFLWNGALDALEESIKETITGRTKRKKALKKFADYFLNNRERMRYSYFKTQGLPCGSGHVESAVRRIINLRLKAAGTFWLKKMAECFLFLRSQLISGRWKIFIANLTGLVRRAFLPLYGAKQIPA